MTEVPNWVTLTDDEEVVWQGRPTLFSYLDRMVFPVFLILAGVVVWLIANGSLEIGISPPSNVPLGLIGLGLAVFGLFSIVQAILEWWAQRYLITTEELYRKHGVLSRHVSNVRMDRVHNTSFSQSLLGRVLGHGDVYVDTAGGGRAEVTFKHVSDPEEIVSYITEEVDTQRS